MQNSKSFFHFTFNPSKLKNERKKAEKKYKNAEKAIAEQRKEILLPRLLELIRNTSIDKLNQIAENFTKIDIRILIYEYPFPYENKETRHKINKILKVRYTSLIGRTAWELFQQDTSDSLLQDLIRESYLSEPQTFLGIKEEYLVPFRNFKKEANVLKSLLPFLLNSKFNAEEILRNWKVKESSVLETALIKMMLHNGLSSDFLFKRDGDLYISQSIQRFPLKEYKELLKIYLEPRDFQKFHFSILNEAIKYKLGDPRKREEDWNFLSSDALSQVKKWVIRQNLEEIFASDPDNKRFNYWKRFIKYMEDVELISDPKVAFIYFEEFVVVEFGNIGSAYFYHRSGFEKFILPIKTSYNFKNSRSNSAKENMLKVRIPEKRGIHLFINKLDHRGEIWKRRFDEQMQRYLSNVDE